MKNRQRTSGISFIVLALLLSTCKGGCDKKCKDETEKGTIYVSTTLLSGFTGCGSPPTSMIGSYNQNQSNAFSDSRSADSKWYVKFTITGFCDDEKEFRIVKEGPDEAIPTVVGGVLYFTMKEIPINRDLTISSEVRTPCFVALEGCCPTGSETNNARVDYMSAQSFNQVVDEEKLDASLIELFPNCGCSL